MEKMKITANILFSGIGCQEEGLKNSEAFDLNIVAISEVDRNAVLSHAAIHERLTKDMVENYSGYPSEEEMVRELTDKNIGLNPKSGKTYKWDSVRKDRSWIIRKNWLASRLSNNLGDISRIESLPEADLWTVSFPCTDISCAGKQEGLKEGSGTGSSLLWENIRLLEKAAREGTQPKFLMFENVKNLVGKKFMPDFQRLLEVLEGLGYRSYWKVLNAEECGVPQDRERVFVVCIRKDIDTGSFTFPQPFECSTELEDILCPDAGREILLDAGRRDAVVKMLKTHGDRHGAGSRTGKASGPEGGGEVPDAGGGKKRYAARKLSPRMCFRLMGLKEEYVEKCRALGVADTHLFRQAGNGIAAGCVQLIGEHLYKAVADPSFVCTDEKYNGAA